MATCFDKESVNIVTYLILLIQGIAGQCSSDVREVKLSGDIPTTLHYPSDNIAVRYQPNDTCKWRFTGQQGRLISLRFKRFDVESSPVSTSCVHDNVTLYSVDTSTRLLNTYCNGNRPPADTILPGTPHAQLEFRSNSVIEHFGFSVEAKMTGCNTKGETVTSLPALLSYPKDNQEKYITDRNCHWVIRGPNYIGQVVTIEVEYFDVPNMRPRLRDYLAVYDGSSSRSPRIGRYNNNDRPPNIIQSTGRDMFIELKSLVRGSGGFGFYFRVFMSNPNPRPTSAPTTGISRPARIGIGIGACVLLCCVCSCIGTCLSRCKNSLNRDEEPERSTQRAADVTSHSNPNFADDENSPPGYGMYTLYPVPPTTDGEQPRILMTPPPYDPKPMEEPPPYSEVAGPVAPPPEYSANNTGTIDTTSTTGSTGDNNQSNATAASQPHTTMISSAGGTTLTSSTEETRQ